METTLQTVIPMLYMVMAAFSARKVYFDAKRRLTMQGKWERDKDDWAIGAIFQGLIWPVAMPLYFALTFPSREERRNARITERKQSFDHAMRELEAVNRELRRMGIPVNESIPEDQDLHGLIQIAYRKLSGED